VTKDGDRDVFGASFPGPIWRQFMTQAAAALQLDKNKFKFGTPKFPAESTPARPAPTTSATAKPNPSAPTSTPSQRPTQRPSPSLPVSPPPRPSPTLVPGYPRFP
jgi:hypothetical protein